MKNACMFLVAAALVVPTGAVLADPPGHTKAWDHKDKQGRAYKQGYREGRRGAQSIGSNTRLWRGDDGRYYCKRDDGTTGLIIGAADELRQPWLRPVYSAVDCVFTGRVCLWRAAEHDQTCLLCAHMDQHRNFLCGCDQDLSCSQSLSLKTPA